MLLSTLDLLCAGREAVCFSPTQPLRPASTRLKLVMVRFENCLLNLVSVLSDCFKVSTTFDTYLALYNTSACQVTNTCNDDGCGNTSSLMPWPMSSGDVVYVRVTGFGGAQG
jgi:hypothetical protein